MPSTRFEAVEVEKVEVLGDEANETVLVGGEESWGGGGGRGRDDEVVRVESESP